MRDDLDDIKREYDLPGAAEALGTRLKGNRDTALTGPCPFHDDQTQSFGLKRYPWGWHWQCYTGCGKGSAVDFVMARDGVDAATAIARLREEMGGTPAVSRAPRPPPKPQQRETNVDTLHAAQQELEAAQRRLADHDRVPPVWRRYGLTKTDAQALGLGINERGDGLIGITDIRGEVVAVKLRRANADASPKYQYLSTGNGSPAWVVRHHADYPATIITEGELNAAALATALADTELPFNVVGLPGASVGEKTLNEIADLIARHDVYIYADADDAGNTARAKWQQLAEHLGAAHVGQLAPLPDNDRGGKTDFAAMLVRRNKGDLALLVESLVEDVEPEVIASEHDELTMLGATIIDPTAPIPEPDFVVAGMIEARKINLIAAYGGVGKSALASHLSVCLALREPFLERPTNAVPIGAIVYLDFEGEKSAAQRWVRKSLAGFNRLGEPIRIHYMAVRDIPRWQTAPVSELFDELLRVFAGQHVVIILDTFEAAFGIDSNKSLEVIMAMAQLKRFGRAGHTPIVLDHLPKRGSGQSVDDITPTGSVQKTNQARSVTVIGNATPDGYEEGATVLQFRCVKLNNAAMWPKFAVERKVTPQAAVYKLVDLPDAPELLNTRGRPKKVDGEALVAIWRVVNEHGPIPISHPALVEVATEHDLSERSLRRALQTLEFEGRIASESDGRGYVYTRRGSN